MILKEVTINHTLYILRSKPVGPEDYHVDLEAFHCVGEVYSEMGVEYDPPKKIFLEKGKTCSEDTSYELDNAQRVFEGDIKWDGCSNLDFFPDRKGNEHFCGKQSATDLGLLVGEAYEFARELMGSKVDDDCFYT